MIDPDYFIQAFERAGVDYVLIGGLAAMIHGSTRVTKDIDFAYLTTRENKQKICTVVNALNPRILTPDLLTQHSRVQIETAKGPVNLYADVDGFTSYASIKHRSEIVTLRDGLQVRVLTRVGVIKSKRATQRPKDVEDLRQLEALAEAEAINLSGSMLDIPGE